MNNKRNKFFKAIKLDNYQFINCYIKQGYNINSKNKFGNNGLDMAILNNNMEMVHLFIRNGAIISNMACHYAASVGNGKILEALLCYDVDVNARDNSGRTPLHLAAQEEYSNAIEVLIKNGAQVNVQDKEGQTPLYVASAEGYYDISKLLIENNAIVDLSSGITPFCIACIYGNYKVASLLLENGADVNARDEDGRTTLFYAKIREDDELIKYLVSNGADDEVVDKYGISIHQLNNPEVRNRLFKELY